MLDFDSLREIVTTIKTNKLRTFLTGFSIAWGIFMLIFLLGAGNGLSHGVEANFFRRAKNSITIWPGATSIPYKGLPIDRQLKFDQKDLDLIKRLPEVEYISGQISRSSIISYDKEYGSWNMLGVHPGAAYLNNIDMSTGSGRFINEIDIHKKRKVIVINTEMQEILFKDQSAIGRYVTAQGISFLVIGVYKDQAGRTNIPTFIPFSTAQSLYNQNYGMDKIDFSVKNLNTIEENEAFIERLKQKLGALHKFDPKDGSAIYMWNSAANSVQTVQIFKVIKIFIWVVGILSLIAGIVGVANIMLITVKERTREFGIRKAIGASPGSILRLVLLESIIITAIFGYLGMLVGIGVTEVANIITERMAEGQEPGSPVIFANPTVEFAVVFQATLVLIISGVIAGCIPALRAVKISPVEAMRSE